MKVSLITVALAALVFAGVAQARPAHWYATADRHGRLECEKTINESDVIVAGPFDTRQACLDALDGPPVNPPAAAPVVPPQDSGSFLCYSIGGDLYTVTDKAEALAFEAEGYWLPTARANGDGTYTLLCAAPGSLGVDGNAPAANSYTDNNGDLLDFNSADSTDWVGVYPIA